MTARHPLLALLHPFNAYLTGALLSVGAASVLAVAAPPETTNAQVQARYEQERARCLSGQAGQAQTTCLTEAVAARDAALKGKLSDGDAKYRKNAKERCDALSGDDKRDCLDRVKGNPDTSVSGSVKGGGVLKETVTVEVKPAPVAASGVPAASVN